MIREPEQACMSKQNLISVTLQKKLEGSNA